MGSFWQLGWGISSQVCQLAIATTLKVSWKSPSGEVLQPVVPASPNATQHAPDTIFLALKRTETAAHRHSAHKTGLSPHHLPCLLSFDALLIHDTLPNHSEIKSPENHNNSRNLGQPNHVKYRMNNRMIGSCWKHLLRCPLCFWSAQIGWQAFESWWTQWCYEDSNWES